MMTMYVCVVVSQTESVCVSLEKSMTATAAWIGDEM